MEKWKTSRRVGGRRISRCAAGPMQRQRALSAALDSNAALQCELKRLLSKTRSAQIRNRRRAARVAASLSRRWNDDDDDGPREDAATADACGVPPGRVRRRPRGMNRREARGFFVDRRGAIPNLSWSDTASEHGRASEPPPASTARLTFERNDPLVSREEPQKKWDDARRKSRPATSVEVAPRLRIEKSPPLSADDQQQAHPSPVVHFTFADASNSKEKFSKQESLSLVSAAGATGRPADDDTPQARDVDWHEVATKHFAKFGRQTPWLCFRRYRSSLQNPASRCRPWSSDEDELMLKCIAAQGSQYLHQGEALALLCRSVYPLRNPQQLAARAQATLVNPNYKRDAWSTEEKRKLALLMRAYSNEPSPIRCAAHPVHFPQRALKSVAEKWTKTLDPTLSHRPFAEEEDDELCKASRPRSTLRTMLPNRSRQAMKRRFEEIADDQTVAKDCRNRLIGKAFVTRGRKGAAAVLDRDDFVVLPRPKAPRPTRGVARGSRTASWRHRRHPAPAAEEEDAPVDRSREIRKRNCAL